VLGPVVAVDAAVEEPPAPVVGPVVEEGPLVALPPSPVVVAAPVPVPAVTLLLSGKLEGSSASPSAHANTSQKGAAEPARRASRTQEHRAPVP
jgi:hypothetical protein